MTAIDSKTLIPVATSITSLLSLSLGYPNFATATGEVNIISTTVGEWWKNHRKSVNPQKIADKLAYNQPYREHQNISKDDWTAAAEQIADIINQLSEDGRLAAGHDWKKLREILIEIGGDAKRQDLGTESAKQAFDWVLDVSCQHIADNFTYEEMLSSVFIQVNKLSQDIESSRHAAGMEITTAVVARHFEEIRELAPPCLKEREQELKKLNNFVFNSNDSWCIIEGKIASGKTALLSTFVLNPPLNTDVVSYFISRNRHNNNWEEFARSTYAQLSQILNKGYTKTVGIDKTSLDILLSLTAKECNSDKKKKPLVIIIDGVDEDSYYEHPDDAKTKSILSLLPTSPPEGVKVIISSRPSKSYLDKALNGVDRITLTPSPVAAKFINRNEMKKFFRNEYSVHIGAFIAASNGALTVQDLRKLINMKFNKVSIGSKTIEDCIEGNPGRMLVSTNVGFGGNEVLAYRLGHDAVMRAILREINPDKFGEGNETDDDKWWAELRRKELAPYRNVIIKWIRDRVKDGWNSTTPRFMLSAACSDIILGNEEEVEFSDPHLILNCARYNELLNRGADLSLVLGLINSDCFSMLRLKHGQLTEDNIKLFRQVIDLRNMLAAKIGYVPGVCQLLLSSFNATADKIWNYTASIPDIRERLTAVEEVMESAAKCGRLKEFASYFFSVISDLVVHSKIQDDVHAMLIRVYAGVGFMSSDSCDVAIVRSKLNSLTNASTSQMHTRATWSRFLPARIEGDTKLVDIVVNLVDALIKMAKDIKSPTARLRALTKLCHALVSYVEMEEFANDSSFQQLIVDLDNCVVEASNEKAHHITCEKTDLIVFGYFHKLLMRKWELRKEHLNHEEMRLEEPNTNWGYSKRMRFLRQKTIMSVCEGDAEEARRFALEAKSLFDRVKDLEHDRSALMSVSTALTMVGEFDSALELTNDPYEKSQILERMVKVLMDVGDAKEARRFALEAKSLVDRVKDLEHDRSALMSVSTALTMVGEFDSALELTNDPYEKSQILERMVKVLMDVGDAKEARRFALEAKSLVDRVKDLEHDRSALMSVSTALTMVGEFDSALELTNDPYEKSQILIRKANLLAEEGDKDASRKVMDQAISGMAVGALSDDAPDDLASVAGALLTLGEFRRADEVAARITDSDGKSLYFLQKVCHLKENDCIDQAREVAFRMKEFASKGTGSLQACDVVSALIEVEAFEDALGFADDLCEKARVMSNQVTKLVDEDEDEEAVRQVVMDLKNLLSLIDHNDHAARAQILDYVIAASCEANDRESVSEATDAALELVKCVNKLKISQVGVGEPDDYFSGSGVMTLDSAFRGLAISLIEAGDVDSAEIIGGCVNDFVVSNVCQKLAIASSVDEKCFDGLEFGEMLEKSESIGVSSLEVEAAFQYSRRISDIISHADSECNERDRLLGLARSGIAHSWLCGASVWDNFEVLVRVAPELAVQLVDERILAEPEGGTPPESDPDLGPEGPGGDAGSYR